MPEWLAVLTILFGSGGLLTGILAWRKDAKHGPVEISSGQVADAVAISEVAGSWVKYQDQKLKEYDERLGRQESRLRALEKRLMGWTEWYRDLELRWGYHKQNNVPPAPPTIVNLESGEEQHAQQSNVQHP